jgi:hypothetical protein
MRICDEQIALILDDLRAGVGNLKLQEYPSKLSADNNSTIAGRISIIHAG